CWRVPPALTVTSTVSPLTMPSVTDSLPDSRVAVRKASGLPSIDSIEVSLLPSAMRVPTRSSTSSSAWVVVTVPASTRRVASKLPILRPSSSTVNHCSAGGSERAALVAKRQAAKNRQVIGRAMGGSGSASRYCANSTRSLRLRGAPRRLQLRAPFLQFPHMANFGTPHTEGAFRVMLLGSGELGKEVAIELQRFAVEVIAVDRYANAPAMQVAHRSHVIDMLDGAELRRVIELERPALVVPEIEAIHTPTLVELEQAGLHVVPTARAAWLTMDREGIRRLAAEELGLPTSPYRFVDTRAQYLAAIAEIGLPCVVKPVMSSSGKGQSTLREAGDVDAAWDYAQSGGRAGKGRCIVEGFVDFDFEITQLTVRHAGGT